MPDFTRESPSSSTRSELVDVICHEFESAWSGGQTPDLGEFLARGAVDSEGELFSALLKRELQLRHAQGDTISPADYLDRFPHFASAIGELFHEFSTMGETLDWQSGTDKSKLPSATNFPRHFGDYELLEKLGEGGMGTVYKARQHAPNRLVALKLIRPPSAASPAEMQMAMSRFRTETEAAARLDHANLITVYDVGEVQGQPYFAMQYVDGESLRDMVDDGPLEPRAAARYLQQVARALADVHALGILHRDLKPHNVMVETKTDRTLLADFGLAKFTEGDQQLTVSQAVIGSPSYMSPEQTLDAGKVTAASDVYGLGATLYHLLTGRPPFQAASAINTMLQVQSQEPAGLRELNSSIPKDLETICLKCLEKEPQRRYQKAAELADDLDRWRHNRPITARRVGVAEKSWLWCKRRPLVAALLGLLMVTTLVGTFVAVERNLATRAAAKVQSVTTADIAEVPKVVAEFDGLRYWADPLLRKQDEVEKSHVKKLRLALALLPVDETKFDYLQEQLLVAQPQEALVVRESLRPFSTELIKRLWAIAGDEQEEIGKRFNAACALAAYDAENETAWQDVDAPMAKQLVQKASDNPRDYQPLTDLVEPIADVLVEPLGELTRDATLTPYQRRTALLLLLEFGRDRPAVLGDVLLDVDAASFPEILAAIEPHAGAAARVFESEIGKSLEACDSEEAKEVLAKRQARAAMALLLLDMPAGAWPAFAHREDPRARSYLINQAPVFDVPPAAMIAKVSDDSTEVSIRRALLLCLGEYDKRQLPKAVRQELVPQLLDLYRSHPDAGLHAASAWLLGQWGEQEALTNIDEKLQETAADYDQRGKMNHRQWYINSQGQTMANIRGGDFLMGVPVVDADRYVSEALHSKRIDRDFALAATPVTLGQYQHFMRENPNAVYDATDWKEIQLVVKTDDSPVTGITWYEAANYCNWLSKVEGIPENQWCYLLDENGRFAPGMRAKSVYLRLAGYRLVSEAEWEYACRSGATTDFHFGNDETLLGEYAWYLDNADMRTWPVGQKKPNDFGLFDMHGNAWTWCQNSWDSYNDTQADVEDLTHISDLDQRTLRGGAFNEFARYLRAYNRGATPMNERRLNAGFRIARTTFDQLSQVPVELKPLPKEFRVWRFEDKNRGLLRQSGEEEGRKMWSMQNKYGASSAGSIYIEIERTDTYVELLHEGYDVHVRLSADQALWSVDQKTWTVLDRGKAESK